MANKVEFDGENKLIIIKSGVTNIDVQIDLYSDWKEWVTEGDNAKWKPAFRTFGGDETTEGQYAPRYFFLTNNWRVVASNVNCTLQTNLYSDDYDSPFIINNAAVTNRTSDVAIIRTEIEKRLDYGDRIYYDETSQYSGVDYPVGTIAQPVNNLADAISLSNIYNIKHFYSLSNIYVSGVTGMTLSGYSMYANRENLIAHIHDNTFIDTYWNGFIVDMDFGNGYGNSLDRCVINNVTNISGKMLNCQIGTDTVRGTIKIKEDLIMDSCYSGVAGENTPLLDMSSGQTTSLSIRGYSGGIELTNCDTPDSKATVELIAGNIIISSACTDGYIDLRGVGYLTNDAGSGCTVETKGFVYKQTIEDAVWDASILGHQDTGSTGYALYNVSAGATPEVIANAVWNQDMSGYTTDGSAGYMLSAVFESTSGETDKLDTIYNDVKRILGLTQENFLIKDQSYDDAGLLQSATIRIFNSSTDCDNDINPLAQYSMTALYDPSGRLTNYKVTKV